MVDRKLCGARRQAGHRCPVALVQLHGLTGQTGKVGIRAPCMGHLEYLPLSIGPNATIGKKELLDLVLESIVVGAESQGQVELRRKVHAV